jgi:hypothetical protein
VPQLKRLVAVSHSGGPGSSPGLIKWDLWWTKCRWGRFSPSTSVSPADLHSTKFSILIITRSRYNRSISGRRGEWTQFGLRPPLYKLNKLIRAEAYAFACFSGGTPCTKRMHIQNSMCMQCYYNVK